MHAKHFQYHVHSLSMSTTTFGHFGRNVESIELCNWKVTILRLLLLLTLLRHSLALILNAGFILVVKKLALIREASFVWRS